MPELCKNPTLSDIQKYVKELEEERGFAHQNSLEKCLLLGEEIGELFKAVRKSEKMNFDNQSKYTSVGEELADIIIYLCSIANRYEINLEEAFRNKEEINKNRTWE